MTLVNSVLDLSLVLFLTLAIVSSIQDEQLQSNPALATFSRLKALYQGTPSVQNVTFLVNGEDWGGIILDIGTFNQQSFSTFLNHVAHHLKWKEPVSKVQLFNSMGQKLESFEDINKFPSQDDPPTQGESRVWAVPHGDFFVYPGIKVGFERVLSIKDGNGSPLRMITRALSPKVFEIPSLLSYDEADHLKALGVKKIEEDEARMGLNRPAYRNSKSAFLAEDTVVSKGVSRRVSELTHIPELLGEQFNCNQYSVGQHFHPHHDIVENYEYNRNRLATVVIYLQDVEAGGATNFPRADNSTTSQGDYHAPFTKCDRGISVYPSKGAAAFFYNMHAEQQQTLGRRVEDSLHVGCDVERGEKWICNKWMNNKYDVNVYPDKPLYAEGVLSEWKATMGPYLPNRNPQGFV